VDAARNNISPHKKLTLIIFLNEPKLNFALYTLFPKFVLTAILCQGCPKSNIEPEQDQNISKWDKTGKVVFQGSNRKYEILMPS